MNSKSIIIIFCIMFLGITIIISSLLISNAIKEYAVTKAADLRITNNIKNNSSENEWILSNADDSVVDANTTNKFSRETNKYDTSSEGNNEYNNTTNDKNPIDRFFDNHPCESSVTSDMYNYGDLYAKAWEAEMLNAYNLFKKLSNPNCPEALDTVNKSEKAYVLYVDKQADFESLYDFSTAFGVDESGKPAKELCVGTDSSLDYIATVGSLYRKQALRLYHIIYQDEEPKYIFDEVIVKKALGSD